MPQDPRVSVSMFVPTGCAGTETDACPEAMNLGPELSASTEYDDDFPTLSEFVNDHGANTVGRDDAISFLVGGNYISKKAAEIEGMIVVLGDFVIEPNSGLNSLVYAGVGSGIQPHPGQTVMTVGGNIEMKGNDSTVRVMPGGDVSIGGTLQKTGSQDFLTQSGGQIFENQSVDTQKYDDMFADIRVKSGYWYTLQNNGIVVPPLQHQNRNVLTLKAGDDSCLQVFHMDHFDMDWGQVIDVKIDPSLDEKTILINVASMEANGRREVTIPRWGDFIDSSGKGGHDFSSRTASSMLWNFYDADLVTLGGDGGGPQFPGSIVIPNGDLDFFWPGSNGRVVVLGDVRQESQGSEFHNYEFDPPCPLPISPDWEVPESCQPDVREDETVVPDEEPEPTASPTGSPCLDLTDAYSTSCPLGASVAVPIATRGTLLPDGAEIFYGIEFVDDGAEVRFNVANPFSGNADIYVETHESVGIRGAYDHACEAQLEVSPCVTEISEATFASACREDLNGKMFTTVSVNIVTKDSFLDATPAGLSVPECCGYEQEDDSDKIAKYTYHIFCECPDGEAEEL